MMARLKHAYARLRTMPVAGVLASRLVWAVKGALGRPVALPAPAAPPAAPPVHRFTPAPADTRLQLALTAVEALRGRLAALEPPTPAPVAPVPSAAPTSVSVVISTLDRAAWLDRALSALSLQRCSAFEVIVVVGPCQDATDAVLVRHAERVRVTRCVEANLSASRNAGLRMARGEVVAFLDDDAVPEADWLERLLACYADPQVGGAGGYIRDHTGLGFQCKVIVADRFGGSRDVGERRTRLDPPGPEIERYLSLTGANCSFRRDALLAIGGFDEAYAYFLDETDVCLRLAEAGWRLVIAPEAEVHHAYAPSAQRRADRAPVSLTACARSTAYFAWRHASARHGAAAVMEHLHAYAEGLRRDIDWRLDHQVISDAHAERLRMEVAAGLVDGVRRAAGGPRPLATFTDAATTRPVHDARPALRPAEDRLRVCLLSQDYPGASQTTPCGGIAVWTHALANALAAEGHEVTVVTRARSGPPSAAFEAGEAGGVWVHRIAGRPDRRPLITPRLIAGLPASVADPALAAAAEVARIAPHRRFDLVMGPLWDLEAAALVGGPWPVAVSLHTACAQMIDFKPNWDQAYRRTHVDRVIAGERRLLAQAPHVLANSRAAGRDIADAHDLPDLARRAVVIAHGLPDLARGVNPAVREGGVEVLFVGRLERRKGVDLLLEAASRVLQAAPDARFTLVGEDVAGEDHRDAFLRRHSGAPWLRRLRFEGALSQEALMARYAACDLVVVPSRYESFGLTALEAMIFAKSCVASDAGGLGEVVADGESGLLVRPDDADALAAALLQLIGNPGLRAMMGAAARRRYETRFTAAAMARSVEAWMRDVLDPGRRQAAE